MGLPGKGLAAGLILAGLALMIIGYGDAETEVLWELPEWAWHLNNVAMYVAVCLSGLGHAAQGWVATRLRHPMLWGAVVWAAAHLLVNGDTASLVLFGGLGVWAFVQMAAINRVEGSWHPPEPGRPWKDLAICAASLVIYAVVAGVHYWLGYPVIAVLN